MPNAPTLILGSTSRWRRDLLARLRVPFEVQAPDVDETPHSGEMPRDLALRLARAKASAVAAAAQRRGVADPVVIGSDQVADLDGTAIGKPHTHARAVVQLQAMRGRSVVFQTAVAVVRPATGWAETRCLGVAVHLRALSDAEIERYLRVEQPYDCAGSARSEGLGIALLEAVACDDPTALIGLPLITTTRMLREAGYDVLAEARS